jgi:hypothetical protein
MEVQVREKCDWCHETYDGKRVRNIIRGGRVVSSEPCDCQDGYRYSWMEIGELTYKMDKAKAMDRYWNS